MLTGLEVKEVLEGMLPRTLIEEWAQTLGVVERQRKLKVVELVYAAVLASSSPSGAVLADVMRAYFEEFKSDESEPTRKVARSAFYRWFDEALLELMRKLAAHVQSYVSSLAPDLPKPMSIASDWWIVDSTTCKLNDSFIEMYPGCGEYAAMKVHKTLSVGTGAAMGWHISAAREHDSRHLEIDESWRGRGLLADLGYASIARLSACDRHGAYYVIRLKESWKPRVKEIHRGEVKGTLMGEADFDALLDEETIILDGKAVDATVILGAAALEARMVGVSTPKGYCWYLTNLPRRIGPVQVGDIYRVRWEVELNFKVDKSVHVLGHVGRGPARLENPHALETMVHASLVATAIINVLVFRHLQNIPAQGPKGRGKVAPLHQVMLAKWIASAAPRIPEMLVDPTYGIPGRWQCLADLLNYCGVDPNWRRRPSVLDQMRGWKPQTKPKRGAATKPK